MSDAPDPRLLALLGADTLASLRGRLRARFERLDPDETPATLNLAGLSASEYEALALLTGAPARPAKSMRIDLARLDATLREAGVAASLRDALERLDGPIVHRAAMRAAAQARWSTMPGRCRQNGLGGLLQAPAGLGLLKRLARQDADHAMRLIERTEAVLQRLPAQGLPRAQLAAETLGDAHALDAGQAVATLVLAAWRQAEPGAIRRASDPDAEAPEERARDTWARAGVMVNELARPALFLNLPVRTPEHRLAADGEPAYLSLRRLLRSPPAFDVAAREVFVCENPNLVAIAADRLGARCAPLVCTDGMPAAAQRMLLAQLASAGAELRCHGDFDWAGLRIANWTIRSFGARPWRLRAGDYEAAAKGAPQLRRDLDDGPAVAAIWDETLAPAMARHGVSIAEEAVAASLLADLRR